MYSQEDQILIDMHRKYFIVVVKWCRNYVGRDPELWHYAEDWAQEAFCLAVRDKTMFMAHDNKLGWLINSCKHIADNALRRRGVRDKYTTFTIDSPDAPPIEDMNARIESWEDREERKATIQKVIRALTENEMAVFLDYFLERSSQGDTAKKLEKSEEAIRATVRRIRGKVKRLLIFRE
jgi:RNA polymerase sigma factor (sigma-70 family)